MQLGKHWAAMSRGYARTAICIIGLTAGNLALPAQAQDAASVAGTYCLTGVMEVGSCIRLSPDRRSEYQLAYGAYDETSAGTWRLTNGALILDSPA